MSLNDEDQIKQTQPSVYSSSLSTAECIQCKATGKCIADEYQDLEYSDLISIGNNKNEIYCMYCLEAKITEYLIQVRAIEYRFIYFKYYESSYDYQHQDIDPYDYEHSQLQTAYIVVLKNYEYNCLKELSRVKEYANNLKYKILAMYLEYVRFWYSINKIEKRAIKLEYKSFHSHFSKYIENTIFEYLGYLSPIHLLMNIRIDDSLGYIQNMAIGRRLYNQDVIWEYVAVGLGHLLLGLNFLRLKYCYEYKHIQTIRLKGSLSYILLVEREKVFTVQYTRDYKLFGILMEALLLELNELAQFILYTENIEYSEYYKLPFFINTLEVKILDLFIDPSKFAERSRWTLWTKAMRYLLIDFNHLLTVYSISD